jgi:hypothetical protein
MVNIKKKNAILLSVFLLGVSNLHSANPPGAPGIPLGPAGSDAAGQSGSGAAEAGGGAKGPSGSGETGVLDQKVGSPSGPGIPLGPAGSDAAGQSGSGRAESRAPDPMGGKGAASSSGDRQPVVAPQREQDPPGAHLNDPDPSKKQGSRTPKENQAEMLSLFINELSQIYLKIPANQEGKIRLRSIWGNAIGEHPNSRTTPVCTIIKNREKKSITLSLDLSSFNSDGSNECDNDTHILTIDTERKGVTHTCRSSDDKRSYEYHIWSDGMITGNSSHRTGARPQGLSMARFWQAADLLYSVTS